jgi:hydroxymethylpyrimidine/phosphomethylpyrimidine kinase
VAQQELTNFGPRRPALTGAATPVALTIAGSDSSAGAGLQADLKTFSALGVYGAAVVTAVTAQNTLGVTAIHQVPPEIITAQIEAVFQDLAVAAVKTGMLGDDDAVAAVADGLQRLALDAPIVVDPVMVSTSGSRLLKPGAEALLVSRLIPMAALITPNLHEAAALLQCSIARSEAEMEEQAKLLFELGPGAVLLKGGHGSGPEAVDLLFDGRSIRRYSSPRVDTKNTHGTGCTLASAITAFLVRGLPLQDAVAQAKLYLHAALSRADELHIGAGSGPLFHFHSQDGPPSRDQ